MILSDLLDRIYLTIDNLDDNDSLSRINCLELMLKEEFDFKNSISIEQLISCPILLFHKNDYCSIINIRNDFSKIKSQILK